MLEKCTFGGFFVFGNLAAESHSKEPASFICYIKYLLRVTDILGSHSLFKVDSCYSVSYTQCVHLNKCLEDI